MTTQPVDNTTVVDKPGESDLFLGRGADAVVWRSRDGRFVRKQYLDNDRELAVARAEQEFTALQLARHVLANHERVTCPEPYGVDHERGELLLEYCEGEHLNVALSHDRFADPGEIHKLAGEIALSMTTLTEVLSLNQLDFSVRNTLVNSSSGMIYFIDFTTRSVSRIEYSGSRPLEVAVASLLTSTITYQLHQSTLTNMTVSRRLRRLARYMFHVVSGQNRIDPDRVHRLAWRFYWRQSVNRGWKRYIWFNTLGALTFKYLLQRTTKPNTPPSTAISDRHIAR